MKAIALVALTGLALSHSPSDDLSVNLRPNGHFSDKYYQRFAPLPSMPVPLNLAENHSRNSNEKDDKVHRPIVMDDNDEFFHVDETAENELGFISSIGAILQKAKEKVEQQKKIMQHDDIEDGEFFTFGELLSNWPHPPTKRKKQKIQDIIHNAAPSGTVG